MHAGLGGRAACPRMHARPPTWARKLDDRARASPGAPALVAAAPAAAVRSPVRHAWWLPGPSPLTRQQACREVDQTGVTPARFPSSRFVLSVDGVRPAEAGDPSPFCLAHLLDPWCTGIAQA
eukprot:6182831-Pleurochrysis_carterae.AAC.2